MNIGKSKYTIGTLIGFLAGIFFGSFLNLNLWFTAPVLIGIIIILVLFWAHVLTRWVCFCLLGIFLALAYFATYDLLHPNILDYSRKIKVSGEIIAPPKITATKLQALVEYQKTKILVDLPRYPEYKYGDVIKFQSQVTDPRTIRPIDNFDYGQYLLNQNIGGWAKNPEEVSRTGYTGNSVLKIIYSISAKFQESLARILPEPYASFQAGLILGNRTTQIPDSLTSAFNRTGTTHIIAVSGYNITIIISALALCFALFSRRFSFWASLGVILIFVIMTGGSASVVRAGILGGLAAWGKLEGRRVNYLILLLFTASVMLFFNPHQMIGDVSYQLSFLAFAGLAYISPKIQNIYLVKKLPDIVKTVFAETMGAQILCLPVIIYNFGIISLVAPIVNILVLPVVPLSMLLGFVAGLGGLIWIKLGIIFGDIAWFILKYIIVVVESFSKISWAAIVYKTTDWWWVPIYFVLLLIWANYKNEQKKSTTDF